MDTHLFIDIYMHATKSALVLNNYHFLLSIVVIDSWGKLPSSGLLEGSFTSLGDFDECLQIAPNPIISKSKYCSISLRPSLPSRPHYHNLLQELEIFTKNTSEDKVYGSLFTKIHFFYYIKIRIGICMPSTCNNSEIESIAQTGICEKLLIL